MPTLQIGIDASRAKSGAAQADQAFRSVQRSARATSGGLGTMARQMGVVSSSTFILRRHLFQLSAALGSVIGFRQLVEVIGQYQKSLTTAVTMMKATADEARRMGEAIRDAAQNGQFSALEGAEALAELARAGARGNVAIQLLGPTMDVATASGLGLAKASKIILAIMNQYGVSMTEASRVTDVLTNAANSSLTTIEEMSSALRFVGPLAANAGLSLEETAAALEVLANAGIQAGLSGRSFRAILLALSSPTNRAAELFRDIDVELRKIDPTARTLTEVFAELQKSQISVNEAAGAFRRRSSGSVIVLTRGADAIRAMTAANFKATGETHRLARAIGDTLPIAVKKVKNAFIELDLVLGDKGLGSALIMFATNLQGMILVLAGSEERMDDIAEASFRWAKNMQVLGTFLGVMIAYKIAFVAIQTTLGLTLALLSANPLTIIATGIGLAAAALVAYKDDTVAIGDETLFVGDLVIGVWEEIKKKLLEIFDLLRERWNSWMADISGRARPDITAGGRNLLESIVGADSDLGRAQKKLKSLIIDIRKLREVAAPRQKIVDLAFEGQLVKDQVAVLKQKQIDFLTRIKKSKSQLERVGIHLTPADRPGIRERSMLERELNLITNQLMNVLKVSQEDLPSAILAQTEALRRESAQIAAIAEQALKLNDTIRILKIKRALGVKEVFTPEPDSFVARAIEFAKARQAGREATKAAEKAQRTRDAKEAAQASISGSPRGVESGRLNLSQAGRRAVTQFDKLRESETALLRVANLHSEARERLTILMQAQEIQMRAEGGVTDEMIEKLSTLVQKRQQVNATFVTEDNLRLLRQQRDLILPTADAAEVLEAIIEARELAQRTGGDFSEQQEQVLTNAIKLQQALRKAGSLATEMASATTDAFESIIDKSATAAEGVENLIRAFARLALQTLALQPLRDFLQTFLSTLTTSLVPGAEVGADTGTASANARGNALVNGRIVPFARGGVVASPSSFPLSGGRTGSIAEESPEVIMPIHRGSGGDMGVKAQFPRNINVTLVLPGVRDPDSFRRSQGQIATELKRIGERASSLL